MFIESLPLETLKSHLTLLLIDCEPHTHPRKNNETHAHPHVDSTQPSQHPAQP